MKSLRSFIAIDFETCQKKRASPIQIGVVRVIDGVIGPPFTSFVMPPQGFRSFDSDLIAVHGLGPADIRDAPKWDEILPRLQRFVIGPDGQDLSLVAHNASFERSVIRQTSAELGIDDGGFVYSCTLKLARAVTQGTVNHKLDTLAAHYGIRQLRHHDAGDDALVGARLMLHLIDEAGLNRAERLSLLR